MTALDNAPSHWKRTTIGDIADVRLGRQRSPKNHSGDQMRPYLRAANVTRYRLRPDDIKRMNFTDEEMRTYALEENDIVVVEGGTPEGVGECALVPSQFAGHAFQNTLIRVRVGAGVDPRWLMLRLNADCELGGYSEIAQGAGNIQHLSATRYKSHPLHLPPLEEQRQIADELERQLSRVAALQRSRDAAHRRSALLRSAILADLFEGRKLVKLGDLLAGIEAGTSFKCLGHAAAPGKNGVLKLGAVTWGHFIESENKEIPDSITPDPDDEVQVGDLLIGRANTSEHVGATALVTATRPNLFLSDKTLRLVPRPGVQAQWLKAVLSAPQTRRHLSEVSTGTSDSMRNISQAKIRATLVPAQPDDHETVLTELEGRLTRLDHATSGIARAEAHIPELRRSILKAAFEGRLTSTDVQDATSPDDIEEAFAP